MVYQLLKPYVYSDPYFPAAFLDDLPKGVPLPTFDKVESDIVMTYYYEYIILENKDEPIEDFDPLLYSFLSWLARHCVTSGFLLVIHACDYIPVENISYGLDSGAVAPT
jgi:hypothetical protein